ncbi:hypothetical protein GQ54DRAFT_299325 [Martensiomyces pterosporus]|nr:hypothetical protein GQ54DRAFT_299325 [Martensiomyces pterosporus]
MRILSPFASTLCISGLFAVCAVAEDVVYHWDAVRTDSGHVSINGVLRPPVVNTTVGDTLVIHTSNSIDWPIQLALHGAFDETPDGSLGCVIAPTDTLTYKFAITQPGTHWLSIRPSTGTDEATEFVHVPLVAHGTKEMYDYADEYVLIFDQSLGVDLVNGESGMEAPKIEVVPYSVYRIRLINMAFGCSVLFSIDGHEITLIEMDGVEYVPETTHGVTILPGQRVSVLVTAKPYNDFNYKYRVAFNDTNSESWRSGTIEYWHDSPVKSVDGWDDGKRVSELDMLPMENHPLLVPDKYIVLGSCVHVSDNAPEKYDTSIIGSEYSGSQSTPANASHTNCGARTVAVVLDYLQVAELLVISPPERALDVYLDGRVFQVVANGKVKDLESVGTDSELTPILRTAVRVPPSEYVVARFRANTPGIWRFPRYPETSRNAPRPDILFIEAAAHISDSNHCKQ